MIKKVLSTAGVAASLVGFAAMAAPQATAAESQPASTSATQDDNPLGHTAVGETLKEVPILKGNGVSH